MQQSHTIKHIINICQPKFRTSWLKRGIIDEKTCMSNWMPGASNKKVISVNCVNIMSVFSTQWKFIKWRKKAKSTAIEACDPKKYFLTIEAMKIYFKPSKFENSV